MKIGTSILSWMLPAWNDEQGIIAIEQSAKAGFDLIEILLPTSLDINAERIKTELKKNKIEAVCSLNLPKEAHIAFHPKEAEQLMKKAIDKTEALETNLLAGVLHGGIGMFSGNPLSESEAKIIAEVWTNVADYAEPKGIDIAIEPINRYESYVCNTAKNVLDLIEKTGKKNLYVHLDTFHMNIEENNFQEPILLAGNKLKHIHLTESHRGMLGEGTINWDEFFSALKEIKFDGNLVLENFSSSISGMQQAVSLWQISPYNNWDLATGSLAFIKENI